MESVSYGTLLTAFSFADFVWVILVQPVVNWVILFQSPYYKFLSKSLSFLQRQFEFVIAKQNSEGRAMKRNLSSELQICMNEEKDDELLNRQDVEMEMAKMGLFCNPNEDGSFKEIFDRVEFSHLFEEVEPSLEEVKEAFCVFDLNGDGYVDAKELQQVLCSLGFREALNLDACEKMIRAYNKNRDGRIDFNEFVTLVGSSLE